MDGENNRSGDPGVGERKETEEEYDARLEREENERIATEKRRRLEALRDRHQRDLEKPPQNGVRFKGTQMASPDSNLSGLINHLLVPHAHAFYPGRGRMKFIDPELQRR